MNQLNNDVIISCSGKFHAFPLAEQLEAHGRLHTLFTTYAYQKNKAFRKLAKRVDKEVISPSKIKTNIPLAFPIKLYPEKAFEWNDKFDNWVARKIERIDDARIFIGWSGMSLKSLKVAKEKGWKTILERGSSHIKFQDEILREEYAKFNLPAPVDPRVIEKESLEYQLADYIALPTSFNEQTFVNEGIPEEKIFVNPYGVSSLFTSTTALPPDEFTVLYLGRLSIQKGLIYLFQALTSLLDKGIKLRAIFIGSIDEDFKLTANQFVRPEFEFTGHIPQHELPAIIGNSSIAVQPSLQEGLSMVIPQMMSCGVPVIASEHTGAQDIIEDGVNGFMVPARSPEAIAAKIEELYNDKQTLETVRNNVVQKSLNLTWDQYGERYINNLNKLR